MPASCWNRNQEQEIALDWAHTSQTTIKHPETSIKLDEDKNFEMYIKHLQKKTHECWKKEIIMLKTGF
jgi:hypothetical protein